MTQYIDIGKIVNTRGHRGEVRVLPLTDFPERFLGMKSVLLEIEGRVEARAVEKTYKHGKFVIIKFAGIDDMDAAQSLKNTFLKITREELTSLPEDSYYIFDILGLEVYTTGDRHLGRVKDVIQTGANDVYVVEGASPRPLLIPALRRVVLDINIKEGKMVVELPEGLE
ncbi:MAG: ribosome maturation factor RimM [Firmicutes bacterium]|nr:ribosome maturation factor RimM [Bacillota bacterium]